MYKQVIVMRKDLNMRKGKMIAQGAHASMKVIVDLFKVSYIDAYNKDEEYDRFIEYKFATVADSPLDNWLSGLFKKITVSVDSENELIEIYNKAKEANMLCSMIEDAGITEFGGVVTKTCCCIGPALSSDIDKITGHLKLL